MRVYMEILTRMTRSGMTCREVRMRCRGIPLRCREVPNVGGKDVQWGKRRGIYGEVRMRGRGNAEIFSYNPVTVFCLRQPSVLVKIQGNFVLFRTFYIFSLMVYLELIFLRYIHGIFGLERCVFFSIND